VLINASFMGESINDHTLQGEGGNETRRGAPAHSPSKKSKAGLSKIN